MCQYRFICLASHDHNLFSEYLLDRLFFPVGVSDFINCDDAWYGKPKFLCLDTEVHHLCDSPNYWGECSECMDMVTSLGWLGQTYAQCKKLMCKKEPAANTKGESSLRKQLFCYADQRDPTPRSVEIGGLGSDQNKKDAENFGTVDGQVTSSAGTQTSAATSFGSNETQEESVTSIQGLGLIVETQSAKDQKSGSSLPSAIGNSPPSAEIVQSNDELRQTMEVQLREQNTKDISDLAKWLQGQAPPEQKDKEAQAMHETLEAKYREVATECAKLSSENDEMRKTVDEVNELRRTSEILKAENSKLAADIEKLKIDQKKRQDRFEGLKKLLDFDEE